MSAAPAKSQPWTPEELLCAVAAYLEMLALEQQQQPYSKTKYRAALLTGALHNRSASSIELRMQNISAVLMGIGRPYIQGYKPAKNVGSGVTQNILALLAELDTALPDVLRTLPTAPPTPPAGNHTPGRKAAVSTTYERDAAVVAYVLARAEGSCECCGKLAPFTSKNGVPFLEVHHVQPLAAGGPDTPGNTVALCPNCHREAHLGERAEDVQGELRAFLSSLGGVA